MRTTGQRKGREKEKEQRSEEGLHYFSCKLSEFEIIMGQPWSRRNVSTPRVLLFGVPPPTGRKQILERILPALCLSGGSTQPRGHIQRHGRGKYLFFHQAFHQDSVSFRCNPS